MTEPVFDANGWCSDMTLAPRECDEVLLFDVDYDATSGFSGFYDSLHRTWIAWDGGVRVFPTHWKPLGPGPVGT